MDPLISIKTPSAVIKIRRRKDNLLTLRYPEGHEVISLVSEVRHPVIREALESRNFRGGLDLVASSGIAAREDVLLALRTLDGEAINS